MIVGQTLATRAEQGYRALLEATAFGTRMIIETFTAANVPITELIVAGGLLKNAQLMQTYADVLRLPISTLASEQGPALGAAIHAAVAGGAYPDVRSAAEAMGSVSRSAYTPDEEERRGLRPALCGVRPAARLVRPWRPTDDEAPSSAAPGDVVITPIDADLEEAIEAVREEVVGASR